jgi:phosphate/sulfate permease
MAQVVVHQPSKCKTLSSKPQYKKKKKKKKINTIFSWMLVAHAYNPSYSGGRDKEDQGLKPAQTK